MSRTISYLRDRPLWVYVGLPALTVALGMQSMRALIPLATWVLRDRLHLAAEHVGVLALAIFASAFLAALVRRLLGRDIALVVTAGGLGLLRLAMQAWTGDPLGELALAIAGVFLFILFLPMYLGHVRDQGATASGGYALGLLLGLSIDVAIHGAFGAYDLSWDSGVAALVVVIVMVAVQWTLLRVVLGLPEAAPGDGKSAGAGEGHWRNALPWLALGPFLFLQMLVFQNLARTTTLSGWSFPIAFAWTAFAHACGIAVALGIVGYGRRSLWPLAAPVGALLVTTLAVPTGEGALAAVLVLLGQASCAALVAVVVMGLGSPPGGRGLARTTVAHGTGMLLLAVLLFGYYAAYELALPFSNGWLPPVAGAMLGICALASSRSLPSRIPSGHVGWLPLQVSLFLVVVPLIWAVTWEAPEATQGEGYPVRIMTYNLHDGFDMQGNLGMEALAQVIEDQSPDVVALQEVSRGWVVNGSLDMLTWLSQRLGLPYIYGPTAGSLWGNAVLTRYPILEWGTVDLPPRDLLILRGILWARLDVGNGEELLVLATHYHHPEEDTAVRVIQTRSVLEFWGGRNRTVFLGDLNSRPWEEPVEMLKRAGLVDAIDLAGIEPGYTSPPDAPKKRIDYIWLSGDLGVIDTAIPGSLASDHLPVVSTITPKD